MPQAELSLLRQPTTACQPAKTRLDEADLHQLRIANGQLELAPQRELEEVQPGGGIARLHQHLQRGRGNSRGPAQGCLVAGAGQGPPQRGTPGATDASRGKQAAILSPWCSAQPAHHHPASPCHSRPASPASPLSAASLALGPSYCMVWAASTSFFSAAPVTLPQKAAAMSSRGMSMPPPGGCAGGRWAGGRGQGRRAGGWQTCCGWEGAKMARTARWLAGRRPAQRQRCSQHHGASCQSGACSPPCGLPGTQECSAPSGRWGM